MAMPYSSIGADPTLLTVNLHYDIVEILKNRDFRDLQRVWFGRG